jgi:hypothetical protein
VELGEGKRRGGLGLLIGVGYRRNGQEIVGIEEGEKVTARGRVSSVISGWRRGMIARSHLSARGREERRYRFGTEAIWAVDQYWR